MEPKKLPEWLQKLWELSPMLARQAEEDLKNCHDTAIEEALTVIQGCSESGSYSHVERLLED